LVPTVLLVDDSPLVLRVLAQRLVADGFEVRTEPSAAAACAVDPATLTCAVIDIDLPDGSGSDVAAGLRRRRPTLPVAFFSAGASPEAMEVARTHGPVFAKPDVDALMAWMAVVLQPPPTK
jgi:DNA-binding response OmpR family regulator